MKQYVHVQPCIWIAVCSVCLLFCTLIRKLPDSFILICAHPSILVFTNSILEIHPRIEPVKIPATRRALFKISPYCHPTHLNPWKGYIKRHNTRLQHSQSTQFTKRVPWLIYRYISNSWITPTTISVSSFLASDITPGCSAPHTPELSTRQSSSPWSRIPSKSEKNCQEGKILLPAKPCPQTAVYRSATTH